MRIYTVQELAVAARTSSQQVRQWIAQGLPAIRVGQTYRINEDDFEDFIRQRSEATAPAAVGFNHRYGR